MPQKWIDNKIAVEKEELCLEYWDMESGLYIRAKQLDMLGRFWKTYNALKIELYRYKNKPYGIKRLMLGGNGRRLLVDFDTLPKDIQEFLGDPRKADNPLEKYYHVKRACVDYYSTFKRLGNYLSAQEQERYVVNATVIEAALGYLPDWRANRISLGGSTKGAYQNLLKEVIDFNQHLKAQHGVIHTLPGNLRTFQKALKDFQKDGYYAVIRDPEGKTVKNASKKTDAVMNVLEGLFMHEETKPSYTNISRAYEGFLDGYITVYHPETGEVFDPKNYPKLSDATIRNYLAAWDSNVSTTRKRAGSRHMYINNMPYAQMDMPEYANSIISIDDRQPPFWYEKGKRMWFYIGLDVASNCITTFVYGKSKEGIVVEFYRQMVRNYAEWGFGMPKELECESSLNSSFKDTFLKEGNMFEYVKIESNNPQAKIIERRFGDLRNVNEKKHLGWIPRPHARAERNQAKPGKTPIKPYDKLAHDRLCDIEDWNNSIHKNGLTRWEYFCENQHPNPNSINWKTILPHLGYRTKTSCHRGYIKLQGRARAIAENGEILTGDALLEKMKIIEGHDLEVYWLDGNNGDVLRAYAYQDDRLVCEVMELPRFNRARAERTDADQAAITLQMAYKNTVDAYARDHAREIQKLETIDNTPKPERKFKIAGVDRYNANNDNYDEPAEAEVFDETLDEDSEILKYNATEEFEVDAFANYRN